LGSIDDPVSLHRYLYGGDEPINLTDPSGRDFGSLVETVAAIGESAQLGAIRLQLTAEAFMAANPTVTMLALYGLGALDLYSVAQNPDLLLAGGIAPIESDIAIIQNSLGSLGDRSFALFRGVDELERGTGILAKLNLNSISPGSPLAGRSGDFDPVGWEQLVEMTKDKERYPLAANARARGHLLARWFGGPGTEARNIVPLFRPANVQMATVEDAIATALKSGSAQSVYYRVTPIFQDTGLIPRGITMEAEAVDASGNQTQIASQTVLNGK
jgi:hypothetical protein